MSILFETSLGDIVIDLDVEGSPLLCKNIIKLAKARYYSGQLVYNVVEGRYFQTGDPVGDGSGGTSIYGLLHAIQHNIDVKKCPKRFIKSIGRKLTRDEMQEKGRVVAIEMGGVQDTIGSQFMVTIDSGEGRALQGTGKEYFSIGTVVEDDMDVLGKLNALYCDKAGRPYADVRIIKANILDDPFLEDPDCFNLVLEQRNIRLMNPDDLPPQFTECARWLATASPSVERPTEETVDIRISTSDAMVEIDEATEKKRTEEMAKKEDRSNAVMLEMLGDLPSAEMKPPENVLFLCKLNPVTDDDDLTLIFSRFDQNAKAEIIRDQETGDSLQYAFVEFDTEAACNEAYFKMNNALIDDRRIKVDFSQSVSKEWNRYAQRKRGGQQSMRGTVNDNTQNAHRSSRQPTSQIHADRESVNRNRSKNIERTHDTYVRDDQRYRDRRDQAHGNRGRERDAERTHRGHRERSRSGRGRSSSTSSSHSERRRRKQERKRNHHHGEKDKRKHKSSHRQKRRDRSRSRSRSRGRR